MQTATPAHRPVVERFSRQRAAIRAVIDQARRPLSPQEVLDAGQEAVFGLGLATVYRNLKVLLEAGEIKAVMLPGASPRYESANHGHHHHFQCNACQLVFDVPECPGNLAALAPAGFTVEHHEITLYGRCKDCVPPKLARPGSAVRVHKR
jgi:Fur family ferric uptake transcriptional regulator